jgi:hypothetical protein
LVTIFLLSGTISRVISEKEEEKEEQKQEQDRPIIKNQQNLEPPTTPSMKLK